MRPIDLAAWSGNLSSLKLIVEAGAIIDRFSLISSEKDSCDISPLMAASLRGYNSVARTLLEKGSVANQASPVTGKQNIFKSYYLQKSFKFDTAIYL